MEFLWCPEQGTRFRFASSRHRMFLRSLGTDGSKTRLRFSDQGEQQAKVSAEFTVSEKDSVDDIVNTTEGFSVVLCDLKTFLESGRSANLVRSKAELIARGMKQAQGDA